MSSDSVTTAPSISLRSDRLRELRRQRDLSQDQLANLSGISQNQVSRYEAGLSDPSSSALGQLASVFNVTTDYLLGLTDIPNSYDTSDLRPEQQQLLSAYEIGDYATLLELVAARLRNMAGNDGDES